MARITKEKETRKKEIIETAARLFIQKGYEQTAVSDIVKSLDVAQGTFYYHFKSKFEVLEEVVLMAMAETKKALEEIAGMEKDPVDKLRLLTQRLLFMQVEHKTLLEILHRKENVLLHDRLMEQLVNVILPILVEVYNEGRKEGVFEQVYDPELTMDALLAAVIRIAHHPDLSVKKRSKKVVRIAETIISRVMLTKPETLSLSG